MHNLPQLCLNGLSANLRPEDKHYLLRICNVVQKVMWFWSFFNNLIEKLKMIVHKYWSNAPLEICLRSTMWIVLLAEQFWHIAWKVSESVLLQNFGCAISYAFSNYGNMTLSGGKFNWYLSWWELKHTSTLVQRWQNSFTFKTKLPPRFKDGQKFSLLNKLASNNIHQILRVGAHGSWRPA